MFLALQFDSSQTWIARRLASYLSGELHTKITIDRVSIQFVQSVNLEGVYIEDQQQDTLLYAKKISLTFKDLSTEKRILAIDKLSLDNTFFRLVHYKGKEHDNLYFLLSYFSSPTPVVSDTSLVPWKLSISSLSLKNVRFKNLNENDTVSPVGLEFSNLALDGITGQLNKISFVNDSIFATINQLKFHDHSGFTVDEFSAIAKVSSNQIRAENLVIRSPHTNIKGNLTFDYDSFPCFEEFTKQIQWKSNFENSTVSFSDIAYFAHDLWGMDDSVKIDGNFKGSVNRFKGKNATLRWGKSSYFKGNLSMTGLPYIEDTYMDIQADAIQTNQQDIASIPLPPFNENHTVDVPDNLKELGEVVFKGKFTGFFSDFVAYGNITTALGYINSDINLKYDPKSKVSVYSGHLAAHDFDVGRVAMIKDMGKITFNADIKGKGLKLNDVDARMTGMVESLEYKNYQYHSIKVDGEIAKKLFNGAVTVTDPNVELSFTGAIDFRGKLPAFNFNADIRHASLDTLHLVNFPGENILQTSINSHFVGNKLDNLEGQLEIKNTFLLVDKKMYRIGNIYLNAQKTPNGEKKIDLTSDFLDAEIAGKYELATIGDAFKQILPRYLPSVILPLKKGPDTQNFTFDLKLKNTSVITENFLPSWTIDPQTILSGSLNTMNGTFRLDFSSPDIRYGGIHFLQNGINLNGDAQTLSMDVNAGRVNLADSSYILGLNLSSKTSNNHISYLLRLADNDTLHNRGKFKGSFDFYSASHFDMHFDSSQIIIQNQPWSLDPENKITFDSSAITIHHLNFSNRGEAIKIEGVIGDSISQNLAIEFSSFKLDNLNPFLHQSNLVLGGVIDGNAYLSNVRKNAQMETDLHITDLSVNSDTLGVAAIISRYNSEQKIVVANIGVTRGSAKVIDIRGNYYAARENDNLDFTVKLNNFYLHTLERYLSGIMSELNGKVSTDLTLTGTLAKPVFEGTVDFSRASCIVDYLNTRYSFTSQVKVRKNVFDLSGMKIVDTYNNEADVSGKITHDYFSKFLFDVVIRPRKLQMLHTNAAQNSLYYGNAYVSGYAHFYGAIENMNMDINLSPEKGTILNIPLNSTSDVSQSDFITFIDKSRKSDDEEVDVQRLVNLSGVRLNMNLDMNPNAVINIIFDEKIGDVISGSGTGSIRMDINTAGDFNMYGTYIIEKGEYLFTLQNLINKKFIVDPGSRITWAGNPYDATVDLSAIYVVYTSSLYKIIPDSTYKRRIPVDMRLLLTNKLMNPTINYEINVRGVDATEQTYIRSILNSEQEVSKQMFGLLVFNQFIPTAGTGGFDAGSGAGASASELLSNQVSNWLSQVSKDVNIGFNYRAKDTYSREEIQLMFSKSLFNDRLTVEGNIGYTNNVATQSNSNVVGDFYAEYKVSEDGRFRLKGFNRSNNDNLINYTSPYTQGFGVFFRQEFNSLTDLLMHLHLKRRPKSVETPVE